MSEVFNYIFSSLENTEKFIRKQNATNTKLALCVIGLGVYAAYQATKIGELNYRVGKLTRDLALIKAEQTEDEETSD